MENPPEGRQWSLLYDQLTDERAKKGSLEQRGLAVISTSGTLVAIVLGFVALASRVQTYSPPKAALLLLVLALAALVAASAAGLLINLPAQLYVIDTDALERVAEPAYWYRSDAEDLRKDYCEHVKMLKKLRWLNRRRARTLFSALFLEVIALGLMTTSVVIVLFPYL